MKSLSLSILILCISFVSVAWSQQPGCDASASNSCADLHTNNIPQVQHVIVLIQENRTPDNLFGSDAFASQRQLPGADLVQHGLCGSKQIPLQSRNLGNACDPRHSHKTAWIPTYDKGKMDGACRIPTTSCSGKNPEYTYVQSSNVVPLFQIAQQYGYANYMFQTNQGPSFAAHQFLLAGSSAPTSFSDPTLCLDPVTMKSSPCYQWFSAELTSPAGGKGYGCAALQTIIPDIDPAGNEANAYNNGQPCYNHNTLVTLLDNQTPPISWKYYAQASSSDLRSTPAESLWTAPNAIYDICMPLNGKQTDCDGYDWKNYVQSVFPNAAKYPNSYSPILTDLGVDPNQPQCSLPAVSWVVPDGNWSDHASLDPSGTGPSWIAAIVNAVGGYDNNNRKLATNCGYWANTVVLITWDDWGGWYDHVLPWRCNNAGLCSGYPGGLDGAGSEYVYGFRVPLLVVSAYAKPGYISGACGQPRQPSCPNQKQRYIHDFGSILNFIEYAFGRGGVPLSFPAFPGKGISPSYPYADAFAPDGAIVCGARCPHPYSLSDFFNFATPRTFTPIVGSKLKPTGCFLIPTTVGCFVNFTPADPDSDTNDRDEED
jgi:phospholipase C